MKNLFFAIVFLFCVLDSFAVIGSISDPSLSSVYGTESNKAFHGVIKTQITRNMRITKKGFFDPYQEDALYDTLYWKNDFSLAYNTDRVFSFLQGSSFFKDTSLFISLSYQRPIYQDQEEIKRTCWALYLCFGDIGIGFSKLLSSPAGLLSSQLSFYTNLPLSRKSFREGLVVAIGSSLENYYKLYSYSKFQLSFLSTHFLDFNLYPYLTSNASGTRYNVPLFSFHQIGFSMQYIKYSFIPILYAYLGYNAGLNYYGSFLQTIAVTMSGAWNFNKKLKLVLSLRWGDRIFKPKNSAHTLETKTFNADRTFIGLSSSYSF